MAGGSAERHEGIYSIGAVARMLGVPASTLRAWEERYQQVMPRAAAVDSGCTAASRSISSRSCAISSSWGCNPQTLTACWRNSRIGMRRPPSPSREPSAPRGAAARVLIAERDAYAAEFSRLLPAHGGLHRAESCSTPVLGRRTCAANRRRFVRRWTC